MNKFWNSLSKILNILGILSLAVFIMLILNLNSFMGSQYWILGLGVIWVVFLATVMLFIMAANLKWLPAPKDFERKSIKETLQDSK